MRIAVLGAGVVGVTAAWYLAEAGHEVTVLDRRTGPGLETSFANGGQISAGHAEPWARPEILPKILRWIGREDAPLLFRLRADARQWEWGLRFLLECRPNRFQRNCRALGGIAAYSRECLRALRRSIGLQYDQLERGILHFATVQRDLDALAHHAEAMRAFGVQREVKSAADCLTLEPALKQSEERVLGGVYSPLDESGDAHKFTTALAQKAHERGVRFETNTVIGALRTSADAVDAVVTSRGEVRLDAYVAALGSYSPLLLRPLGIRIPVYPLKGYSVTLTVGANAPTVSLTDEAFKIVISRFGERLRAAGTAELTGYDDSINAARCEAIAARLRVLFPALRSAPVVHRWAGLRPATPSNVPVIGRTRFRNLFLNTGHGTLGWTLACGSGRVLADVIAGRKPEVDFPLHA